MQDGVGLVEIFFLQRLDRFGRRKDDQLDFATPGFTLEIAGQGGAPSADLSRR
ncbi:MAG TPA: hypothetical protein VMT32_07715 [Bryobacteraceae bacterium]|nr:hypothetical protein [Bryobacteraceae bacterium]